jgi:hypothetical protein
MRVKMLVTKMMKSGPTEEEMKNKRRSDPVKEKEQIHPTATADLRENQLNGTTASI